MEIIYIAGFLIWIIVMLKLIPINMWIVARMSGVKVKLSTLTTMNLRKVPLPLVIKPLIKAHKAGLDLSVQQLENHYLAGGNVNRVVNTLIKVRTIDVNLSFHDIAMLDLADDDIFKKFKD